MVGNTMAFLDFLQQPMGGYGSNAGMQGPTPSGATLGTTRGPAQGPTWGNLLQAAANSSSTATPATKGFMSLLPSQPGQTGITPLPGQSTLPDAPDPTKGGTGNQLMGMLSQLFGGLFGLPGV